MWAQHYVMWGYVGLLFGSRHVGTRGTKARFNSSSICQSVRLRERVLLEHTLLCSPRDFKPVPIFHTHKQPKVVDYLVFPVAGPGLAT